MLNGLKNFLQIINDNWTTIVVIVGLIVSIALKVKQYVGKSKDERIKIAKAQLQEVILKLISNAEIDYEGWNKAGSIKRSQVIQQIFDEYPVFSKVIGQEQLVEWIDELIDTSLVKLKEVISLQTKE